MSFDPFEWMIAVTILSIPMLFIIFKRANEVIISADIRPASMQIIFLLVVTPTISLIVFTSGESWENVESYETLVVNEQKTYPELFASYQTLLDSIESTNTDNKNEIKKLQYKKLDNYRDAIISYQHVYMEKNYIFSSFYPLLTKMIDQIEIDIINNNFKDAVLKLKESHKQLLNVRTNYLDDLKERKILTETKLWLLIGMLAFLSVFILALGVLWSIIMLYTDKILVDVYKKLLDLEQSLNMKDREIFLKVKNIMSKKYFFLRGLELLLVLGKVYKVIETQNRLECLVSRKDLSNTCEYNI